MRILSATLALTMILLLSACNSGNDTVELPQSLEGTWSFRLMPTAEHKEADPEVEDAMVERVLLVVQGKELIGELGTFHFRGYSTALNEIHLTVSEKREDDTLHVLSEMDLTFNGSDLLEGVGENLFDEGKHVVPGTTLKDGTIYDHGSPLFLVSATKASDEATSPRVSTGEILETACELATKTASFAISKLTQNAIRPMEGCGLQRVGRGFYVFGRTGPGNSIPAWTHTFWLPQDFYFCASKQFYFTMRLQGEHSSIERLEEFVSGKNYITQLLSSSNSSGGLQHDSPIGGQDFTINRPSIPEDPNQPPTLVSTSRAMSYEDADVRLNAMSDLLSSPEIIKQITSDSNAGGSTREFVDGQSLLQNLHSLYGGFGLSVAYDAYTNNASIYMSISRQNNAVFDHPILKTLEKVLYDSGVSTVYRFSGPSIDDHWRLKISAVPVVPSNCTTPLVIAYLLGTHNVNYD